ncbi:DUF2339 domain-containing protein [Chryseobacterium sp. FH1]|uniref:DUF2339 domain-containing protein n=1 Tax=Chryseobacterium sp. FH1 TaxID=1233951 RepID=UPI0004E3D554|nr:DUF2339 domain-containing protein [Chryseobacterium sp. FH1]KFC24571.1 hypothetical protein IO90_00180 [Chryseobacterium sp. FH1]
MEVVLLLAILIFTLIIYNRTNQKPADQQQNFKQLNNKIDDLKEQISTLRFILNDLSRTTSKEEKLPIVEEEKPTTDVEPKIEEPIFEKTIIEESITEEQESVEKTIPQEEAQISQVAFSSNENPVVVREEILEPAIPIISEPIVPKKSWIENFKEKNPDIEKFIGENLINKIGILILVLGISFFVKYAIDKDWINEPARVGIGILSGAIVMVIAHRLKKNYVAFSSVFVAGAISIFYLTIGIAFHDYKLFSQTVAFIIMVVITIFSVLFSVSYDRKELAILSLIGGFAVPFMVSTGEGNYKVLFTYIAILNIGMLIIAYFKKWNLVTLLAFIFTCVLFSGWFGVEYSDNKLPYRGALFFATIFYIIFSIATVINNIRNKGGFTKMEYFLMLANTFFYFGMGASIIQSWKPEFKGLFTIALALYNLVFAMVLYRKFGINKNAIYFLLGLALTFVTLTIPFQFNGNYITLFWAGEAVLLLWLSQKSKISTFKFGAIVVQILMLFSLFIDWNQYYHEFTDITLKPFFNKIFITGLVALASLVATYYLLKKEKEITHFYFLEIDPKTYRNSAIILSVIIGYFVGMFEVFYQSNEYITNYYSATSLPVLYHFIFSAGLIFFVLKRKNNFNTSFAISLAGINILLYLIIYFQLTTNEMVENITQYTSNKTAYFTHYLLLMCLGYFLYIIVTNRANNEFSKFLNHKFALWLLAFCVVYILSNEVMIHSLIFSGDIVDQAELAKTYPMKDGLYNADKVSFIDNKISLAKIQIIKIGYPILWGVLSFIFLIVGIRKQNKPLRIISLSLLGLTIAKLFLFDITNVSETGKIIAFILLGVLILIISFVYQKIKKLVIDEQPQNTDNEDHI